MASSTDGFKSRAPSSDFSATATFPRTLRLPTPEEMTRGLVVAYAPANFTVYRAVIERLRADDRFRMETQVGDYEMSRAEFEDTFWSIVTASYRTGSDSMPGRCYSFRDRRPTGRIASSSLDARAELWWRRHDL